MQWLPSLLAFASLSFTSLAAPAPKGPANPTFSNVTIFAPPANYTIPRTLYARTLELSGPSDVLLATWENYLPDNDSFPYFPIYQSYDGGLTWSERAKVYDQVNGWGLRYQPFLYELTEPIGNFCTGDILLTGNSIPNDLSQTQIDLYVSKDKGYTWTFVSHIAHGGEAVPDNGLTPVWEPFLMIYEGSLVVFYSDQRDPLHGQKLVHQVSSDALTWGPVVDDVAYANYTFRPGMTTVSYLPVEKKYIMTYEFYGAPEAAFAVYHRISDSPLTFNEAVGTVVVGSDGTVPVSSPYNVWTPVGGEFGTVAVSCGTLSTVFLNRNVTGDGTWEEVSTPEGTSYTRNLRVLDRGKQLLITGGGVLSGTANEVTTSRVNIEQLSPV